MKMLDLRLDKDNKKLVVDITVMAIVIIAVVITSILVLPSYIKVNPKICRVELVGECAWGGRVRACEGYVVTTTRPVYQTGLEIPDTHCPKCLGPIDWFLKDEYKSIKGENNGIH
jgi:hypothetical protein